MITLKNSDLTVLIAERGAELKSVSDGENEYLWNARPEVWANSAPLLFPICGGLKEDRYTHGGKEYLLTKHGYAKYTDFELEAADGESAVFLHRSDERTRQSYPFDYELRVHYTLRERSLRITYTVKNLSAETMYFSIGSHEAYYTPEGIEDYDVVFDTPVTLLHTVLNGNLLTDRTLPILKESCVLPLYEKFFFSDALVFRDVPARAATLRNRRTGRQIRVEFPDSPHLLLWHKANAPFFCIEPWSGIPDVEGSSYELSEKAGILSLAPAAERAVTHTVTF